MKMPVPQEIQDLCDKNNGHYNSPMKVGWDIGDVYETKEYLMNNYYNDIIKIVENQAAEALVNSTLLNFKNAEEEKYFHLYLRLDHRKRIREDNKENIEKRKDLFALAMLSEAFNDLDCFNTLVDEIKAKHEPYCKVIINITQDEVKESLRRFRNRELPESIIGDKDHTEWFTNLMEEAFKAINNESNSSLSFAVKEKDNG